MNVKLLERVRREIVGRPERFTVAHWAWARNAVQVIEQGAAPEGFKCCIAGHVLLLSGRCDERDLLVCSGTSRDDGSLWQRAAEALALNAEQRTTLFFPSQWAWPYKERYYLCSRQEEAATCASYIDHFLREHAAPPAPRRAAERPPRPPHAPGSCRSTLHGPGRVWALR